MTRLGPFELEEPIGSGGMGQVWRAIDTDHDDRPVALKIVHPGVADDDGFARRFRRESRIVASLRNPHIVPIFRYGEVDGRLFLAMQLVDGPDLGALLDAEGHLEPARAAGIVAQVAEALDTAHRAGLVHRDVKPRNVCLQGPGEFAYLLDFGIARPVAPPDTSLTADGALVGSIAYMAPECFTRGPADHRADVYSLAALLYHCLTGHLPFAVDSAAQAGWAHVQLTPAPPSQVRPGVPEAFDEVLARGLAKAPDERHPSAGELGAAAWEAAGSPAPAPPVAPAVRPAGPGPTSVRHDAVTIPPPPSGAPAGRRRVAVIAVLAALAISAALIVLAVAVLPRTAPTTALDTAPPAGPPAGPPVRVPAGRAAPGVLATIGVGDQPFAAAATPDGRAVYVANERGASVTVVDTGTLRVAATVPVAKSPSSVVAGPDGSTVWVASDRALTAIDTRTRTVRDSVALSGTGRSVTTSRDGRSVLVSQAEGQVTEFDATTLNPVRDLPTAPQPGGLAVSPDGTVLAVVTLTPVIELIDLRSGASIGRLDVGRRAYFPTFSADGGRLYVDDQSVERIAVIDVATRRVTGQIRAGDMINMVLSADGRTGYAHADGTPDRIIVVDTGTNRIVRTIPVPVANSAQTVLSPDGSRAYVVDMGTDRLVVVGL